MNFIAWLRANVFSYDPEPLEYQTALMSMCMGIWIGWPWHTVEVYASPAFLALSTHGNPIIWAFLWIITSSLKIYGAMHRASIIRKLAVFVASILWSIVSWVILSAERPTLAVVIFPIIALSQMWLYIRLNMGTIAETTSEG